MEISWYVTMISLLANLGDGSVLQGRAYPTVGDRFIRE